MMSIGLHTRIMRPGRVASIIRFLKHVQKFDGVWIAKRSDIATHFAHHFALADTWNVDAVSALPSSPEVEK
jgi:allantoinase